MFEDSFCACHTAEKKYEMHLVKAFTLFGVMCYCFFIKVYGTAAHYAEEDKSLRRVHLVFLLGGGTYTKPILEDDMLFNDMLYQCDFVVKNLRSDNLSWAYDYALNFAQLPGGVYITNEQYFPIVSFNTTALDTRSDEWWCWASKQSLGLACGQ